LLTLGVHLYAQDYSSLTAENHPRLVINNTELSEIKSQVKSGTNEPLNLIHSAIMTKADYLIGKAPLTYKKDASGKSRVLRFNLVSEGEPLLVEDGVILQRNGVKVKLMTDVKGVKYL